MLKNKIEAMGADPMMTKIVWETRKKGLEKEKEQKNKLRRKQRRRSRNNSQRKKAEQKLRTRKKW